MATVDVSWDWFVFRMKAYQYIVKVTKFDLPTAHRFSTPVRGFHPPPAFFGLKKGLKRILDIECEW